MHLGRVIGCATATVKHPALECWRLLVVQPLSAGGGPDGEPFLAIDQFGSRRGDRVVLTSDGKSVREMMRSDQAPVRWAVIGIADEGVRG